MVKHVVVTPDPPGEAPGLGQQISREVVAGQLAVQSAINETVGNRIVESSNAQYAATNRLRGKVKELPTFGVLEGLRQELRGYADDQVDRASAELRGSDARLNQSVRQLPDFGVLEGLRQESRGYADDQVDRASAELRGSDAILRQGQRQQPTFGALLALESLLSDNLKVLSSELEGRIATEIGKQEQSSRASALNGDIAMASLIGGDQTISKAVFDPGGETIDVIVELRDSNPQKANNTLVATANFLNTEPVEYGGKTYTFQTVLTDVDGNVLIGATLAASLANLFAAGTLGAGSGTLYAASMTANASATPVFLSATTMRAEANDVGTAGNSLTTTEGAAAASWNGGGTMAGGTALVLDANGQIHNWATNRSLSTGGGGIALAGGATTTPAPTIVGVTIDIKNGRMIFTLAWPAGTYVNTETATVTLTPAAELGAALVPALAVVPTFVLTYTVIP